MPRAYPSTFIGLVTTVQGFTYEVEFDMDTPLFGFDMSHMPDEIECVEILRVVYA